MGLNILTATGNLGHDAEQRFTSGNESVVIFDIPVTAGFGRNEVTTWIGCRFWGKRGESVMPYLKKGTLVAVSGEFYIRKWTAKDGSERHNAELRVNDLKLLGSRPSETSASAVPQTESYGQEPDDTDLPF